MQLTLIYAAGAAASPASPARNRSRPTARVPVTASLQDPVRRTKTYRCCTSLRIARLESSLSLNIVCLPGCCLMHAADFVAFYVILFGKHCSCVCLLFAPIYLHFNFYIYIYFCLCFICLLLLPPARAKKSITKLVGTHL